MAQPQPARQPCAQREELAESLRAAMDRIVALTSREAMALASDRRDELDRLDNELKKAQASKDWLLRKYNSHVKTHGC